MAEYIEWDAAVTFGWLLPWIEKKLRKDGE